MTFPRIQMQTTYARIGIDADLARIEQRQPKATFELRQIPAKLEIKQPNGVLTIDQSKAWDAYGRGGILSTMDRIYSSAESVALKGIASIVERGNRLADIASKRNAIAENAKELFFSFPDMAYEGPASYDNVDIEYTAHKPEIEVIQGGVELNTHPNRPELTLYRGKLDIYMQQYASVQITPPAINAQV